MDHDEASCLFRSTLLPFLVFAYIFVSAVLLVNLLTAQLSKEYDEEYENCSYYNGYLKYDELSKIEAKLLLPPPLSIIYALLHVLLIILRQVFKLLKHMRIGGWCDPCYQFLRKNTIKRMKGDPYQVVKVWREKPEYRIDAIVKNDIKHILTTLFKMIVTWGKPLQVSGSTLLDTSWEDCLQKCWSDAKCVLIHDTSPTCTYYTLGQVFNVEKLTAISVNRVAFRVLSNETGCSDPALEPMLVSGTVQSKAEIDNKEVFYNVTLENDVWRFSSNLTLVCPDNSKMFTRGSVPVCMTIVQSSTCFNRLDADAASCASFGIADTLMGIASWDEFEYVKSNVFSRMKVLIFRSSGTAISFLTNQSTPVNYMRLGVWLDGSRKDTCKRPATKSANCNGNNEYFYSDPYAQNPVFLWRPNQPDGLTIGDADSDCLFFRVSKEANDVAGVGDMPCSSPTYPSLDLCYVGYLCGSYPTYTIV
ncbi:hypothetical protein CAEBREN_06073 [Caenorhabditis brenneri]|uniref:PAN-3 domain-containing protein n=1 Tax=Caenorhabditis brenneri TaxID=135651 RepID=G0M8Z9_CAEBE|nr:hypothetical protein CAEBREN_06073 [Caenorhabditis brenneri]